MTGFAGYFTSSPGAHLRAHTVRPYGLYRGKRHLLACLLMNGLLMYDVEAEVEPVDLNRSMLRVADCVFRIESGKGGLQSLIRV